MQIIGLHKNLYKLYAYNRSQERLDVYRKQYEDGVRRWASLKAKGVCEEKCQKTFWYPLLHPLPLQAGISQTQTGHHGTLQTPEVCQ